MASTNGSTPRPVGPAKAPVAPPRERRMTLAKVTTGVIASPRKLFIYGKDGVGKTTFAAHAPKPIFVDAEAGTLELAVARFPTPESFLDILDAIDELGLQIHEYETVVFDTVDWIEQLIWKEVCEEENETTIEKVGGGYGKGYNAALDKWRLLLSRLEKLQATRNMNVVFLGHSLIKSFKNPEGPDFDRYIVKLNEKAAGLLREWSKGTYFAAYETFAETDKRKRVRGVSTGARVLYTQNTAAYDAKDRYGLPYRIPLDWDSFEKAAAEAQPEDPTALAEEIKRKAGEVGGEIEKAALEWVGKYAGNARELGRMNDRLNAKLAEKREATAEETSQ